VIDPPPHTRRVLRDETHELGFTSIRLPKKRTAKLMRRAAINNRAIKCVENRAMQLL